MWHKRQPSNSLDISIYLNILPWYKNQGSARDTILDQSFLHQFVYLASHERGSAPSLWPHHGIKLENEYFSEESITFATQRAMWHEQSWWQKPHQQLDHPSRTQQMLCV